MPLEPGLVRVLEAARRAESVTVGLELLPSTIIKLELPIEEACHKGLAPPKQFCQADEPEAKMTIPTIVALQAYVIEHGLESVFCIIQADGTEVNMLETPGLVTLSMVTTWINDLMVAGVHDGQGGRHAVCAYDQENLVWSGTALLNSCSDRFRNELVSELGVNEQVGP